MTQQNNTKIINQEIINQEITTQKPKRTYKKRQPKQDNIVTENENTITQEKPKRKYTRKTKQDNNNIVTENENTITQKPKRVYKPRKTKEIDFNAINVDSLPYYKRDIFMSLRNTYNAMKNPTANKLPNLDKEQKAIDDSVYKSLLSIPCMKRTKEQQKTIEDEAQRRKNIRESVIYPSESSDESDEE